MSNKASSVASGLSGLGLKAVALVVMVVAAWILLKVVIGVVTTVAFFAAIVVGVLAVIWALSVLRR